LPASGPGGLAVGPAGKIYFTNYNADTVSVFNTSTPSTPPAVFVAPGSMSEPISLAFVFVPEPGLTGVLAGGVAALLAVARARRKKASAAQSG